MSLKPVSVRSLTSLDAGPWSRLRQALWPDQPADAHLVEIEEMLGQQGGVGYGAFSPDGALVAFAEVSIRAYANG